MDAELSFRHVVRRASDRDVVAVDDDHRRLQAKIGALLMENELLYAKVGLIRSRGHVPKGGYDVPNGSNHTSAVTPAIQ